MISRALNEMSLTKEEIAYWAGIVDGEGSVDITRTYAKTKSGKRIYHFIRLSIYNKNRQLIEDALKELGCGSVQTHRMHSIKTSKRNCNYKDHIVYAWVATTENACRVLEQLLPYLRLKKPQAQLAIEFHRKKSITKGRLPGGSYAHIPQNQLRWREECRQKMKLLNQRK